MGTNTPSNPREAPVKVTCIYPVSPMKYSMDANSRGRDRRLAAKQDERSRGDVHCALCSIISTDLCRFVRPHCSVGMFETDYCVTGYCYYPCRNESFNVSILHSYTEYQVKATAIILALTQISKIRNRCIDSWYTDDARARL